MKNFVIIYAIIQLVSTAYGLAVIETLKPIVKPKGEYDRENKNSLYNYSSTLTDILKGFIPFYYFVKALSMLTMSKNNTPKKVEDNKYLNENKPAPEVTVMEDIDTDFSIFKGNLKLDEKPEKYTARKNDISVYDEFETPIEYITRQNTKNLEIEEKDLELTPFLGGNKVVDHVVIKEEVTKNDIAKAISELDPYELELLRDKIADLADVKKRNMRLKLEKDAA